jgi:hypothetical protein
LRFAQIVAHSATLAALPPADIISYIIS